MDQIKLILPRSLKQSILWFVLLSMATSVRAGDEGLINCPLIDGEYLSSGISDSSFSDYYKNPALERIIFGLEYPEFEIYSVRITLDKSEQTLQLELRDRNGLLLKKEQSKQPIKCLDSWIISSQSIKGSSAESSVLSTSSLTKIGGKEN